MLVGPAPGHLAYTGNTPSRQSRFLMTPPDETSGRRSRRRPGTADTSHAVFDRTRAYRHLRNPFEPPKIFSDDQVAAIGSGGSYAAAAARALLENTDLNAREVAEKAMSIAAQICIYTNDHFTFEELKQ